MERHSIVEDKLNGLYSDYGGLFKKESIDMAPKLQNYLYKEHTHFIKANLEDCDGYSSHGYWPNKQIGFPNNTDYLPFVIGGIIVLLILALILLFVCYWYKLCCFKEKDEGKKADESEMDEQRQEIRDRLERSRKGIKENVDDLLNKKKTKDETLKDITEKIGEIVDAKIYEMELNHIEEQKRSGNRSRRINFKKIKRTKRYVAKMLAEGFYTYCIKNRLSAENSKENKNEINRKKSAEPTFVLPEESQYLRLRDTTYYQCMEEYFGKTKFELNFTLKNALDEMFEVFTGRRERNLINECITKAKETIEQDAKEYETEIEKSLQEQDKDLLLDFNIVSRIWTCDCNVFKWINQALFMDVFQVAIGGETFELFEGAFPGKDENFYREVIQKWAKYMALLNLFITNKSNYGESSKSFRTIGNTSSFIEAPGLHKFRFIQYQATSESLEKSLIFGKESESISVYHITRPKTWVTCAKIQGLPCGKSKYPGEKEHLIMPFCTFTFKKASKDLNEIEGYYSEEEKGEENKIGTILREYIDSNENKTKEVEFSQIVLDECKVKGKEGSEKPIYDPLEKRIE